MNKEKVNIAKIKRYLETHDLDAVIAMNPRTEAYLINVRRFDHYTFQNNLFPDYPVFPRKGDPWLVGAGLDVLLPEPLRPAWLGEYLDSNSSIFEDVSTVLIDSLIKKGLAHARIGLDLDSTPVKALNYLQAGLPNVEFVDTSVLFQQLKAKKTDWEVELLKKSLEALEAGSQRLLKEIAPGRTMQSLIELYAQTMEEAGGIYHGGNWTNSSVEWFPEEVLPDRNIRYSTEWVPQPGEITRVNTLGYRSGYWSDNGMMFSISEPTPEVRDQADLQWQAMGAIVQEMKPGMSAKEAYEACKEAIDNQVGYQGAWDCHSIGLDVMEDPWMGIGNERRESEQLTFEPNTVICIETGSGAEQTFVMGEEGLHCLSILPQKLHIIET